MDGYIQSQKERQAEILASMVEITPETRLQALYAKEAAQHVKEYQGVLPAELEAQLRLTALAEYQREIWQKS